MKSSTRRRLARVVLVSSLLLPLAGAGAAWAQEREREAAEPSEQAPPAEPEGWAYALANHLMSPYCPGRTLADCPSPQAASLRAWIVVQEAAGRPREEVLEELYARYGDVIRPRPRAEGFGTAAYLIPIAVFVAGGCLVFWFLRRWTRRGPGEPAPAASALDPELERQLDEELSR